VLCGILVGRFSSGFSGYRQSIATKRASQASKQMLETHDYVDIRFQDEVRYKKPVGIYWLQAAAVKAGDALGVPQARTTIWLYRVPSLAGAIFAVLLTYWAALAFVAPRAAVVAALMRQARPAWRRGTSRQTDAMLLFTSVAAMGAMARIYLANQRTPEAKLAGAAGNPLDGTRRRRAAKRPLIVMFVGLAAIVLWVVDRSARWLWSLRPITGIVWLLLLVSPWFVAIIARSGPAFS
jgi:4-amino-4-deoxy-L-arabinose transferase-like glycosyltransferase